MKQYHDQLQQILDHGEYQEDRTGTGTLSLFGMQARYDLREGFPLVTTKRVYWKAVVGELLWFLEGSTNRNRLEELTHGTIGKNTTIWDEWADPKGELGPIYGAQWRYATDSECYLKVDQISDLVKGIKENPSSRRHIVSAWNLFENEFMALPPCHTLWQVNISGEYMDLQLYQRSADMFLGVPFNIASYSLLLSMLAQVTGYKPRHFVHTIGNAHIYSNHIEQVKEQLSREFKPLPTLELDPTVTSLFAFKEAKVVGYDPHPTIKAPVAV